MSGKGGPRNGLAVRSACSPRPRSFRWRPGKLPLAFASHFARQPCDRLACLVDQGLERGISVPPITLPGLTIPLDTSTRFYYFALVIVGLAVAGLDRILRSPFGTVLQAIRENSDRAVACGYDIRKIKLMSFVFSALFCGLAGALDALRLGVVPVESLYWTTSGQVVIMTLLGGAGTFFGPFVGATTFLVLEDRLSVVTESWPLFIGLTFMAFVLFLPKGIWGTLLARLR